MDRIRLESDNWSRGGIAVATTFRSRLRGIGAPGVDSVLIETSTVHTFGVSAPLLLIGLDSDLTVKESRVLDPNRIAHLRRSRFILELPYDEDYPEPGATLTVRRV